jgi:hypothetical protein
MPCRPVARHGRRCARAVLPLLGGGRRVQQQPRWCPPAVRQVASQAAVPAPCAGTSSPAAYPRHTVTWRGSSTWGSTATSFPAVSCLHSQGSRLRQMYVVYYNSFDGGIPMEFGELQSHRSSPSGTRLSHSARNTLPQWQRTVR